MGGRSLIVVRISNPVGYRICQYVVGTIDRPLKSRLLSSELGVSLRISRISNSNGTAYSVGALIANFCFLFSSNSSFRCASRLRAAADWAFDVVVEFVLFCRGLFFSFAPCGGGNAFVDSAVFYGDRGISRVINVSQWKSASADGICSIYLPIVRP